MRMTFVRAAFRFRWFTMFCVLLAAWVVWHLPVTGLFRADEPAKADVKAVEPLGYRREGDLELIARSPYKTEKGERRELRVVREELIHTRSLTRQEYIDGSEYRKTVEGKAVYRPSDTFQKRSEWMVFWILDCEPGSPSEAGRPVGVVYSHPGNCGPIYNNFAADLLWHTAREQHLLVLSMSCTSELTVAIFPVDLEKTLDIKPFGIAGKFPSEFPRVESQWPQPVAPIAEMRTSLPRGICDIMAIRAVPEYRLGKLGLKGRKERNLLITAWNLHSATCNSITYRYKLIEREWRVVNLTASESDDEPARDSTRESFRKDLEIPPEEMDPEESRSTAPLEPLPDPALFERDAFGAYKPRQPKPVPPKPTKADP